jgi:hypothetical protein
MIYKIFILLFVVGSWAAEVQTLQVEEFVKKMVEEKSPASFSETFHEIRVIDGYKVKNVQKINDQFDAEIEFNVIGVKRRDEKTQKNVMNALPQSRKEVMKYRFVMREEKLLLAEMPHPFSYSLKTK